MMLFMLYIISTITLSNFGFSHNMFQYAGAPRVFYSDINGYGHFLEAHNWYMLYWSGFAVILACLSHALWHRGPAQPLKARMKNIGYYLGTQGKIIMSLGLAVSFL